jgi:hypothetical protein
VWASGLNNDDALIVSGLLSEGGLGPTMLVVSERDFKRLAELSTWDGRPVYSMGFAMQPHSNSRWLPYLVPTDRLVERFGVSLAGEELIAPSPVWRSDVGFLGEAEVIRLLAENSELNLFRAFPDSETAELLVRHVSSGRVLGLQIKTIGVDAARRDGTVSVLASSFRPSPTTFFVVLAWHGDKRRFDDECLLMPSNELDRVAQANGIHLSFDWHPSSRASRRLDAFRTELRTLASRVGAYFNLAPARDEQD